ncbi:hypothetical protein D3C86_2180460 [compost metagenome]
MVVEWGYIDTYVTLVKFVVIAEFHEFKVQVYVRGPLVDRVFNSVVNVIVERQDCNG